MSKEVRNDVLASVRINRTVSNEYRYYTEQDWVKAAMIYVMTLFPANEEVRVVYCERGLEWGRYFTLWQNGKWVD